MQIEPIEMSAVNKVVNDDNTPSIELIKIIQQLILIIRDHEARLAAGGL